MKRIFSIIRVGLFTAYFILTFDSCTPLSFTQYQPLPLPLFKEPKQPPRIALVLGGGGSKGLAHIGVLDVLEEEGIAVDFIVGCSSGAIIGAFYADQPDSKRLMQLFLQMKRRDLIDVSVFGFRFGLAKGIALQKFLEEHLNARDFEKLRIPFIAGATDLATGAPVMFGGGALIPALQASAAVPGVFKPVYYLGRHLIDGGSSNPLPVDIAKSYGAQIIIAVDISSKLPTREPFHLLGIVRRSLEITHQTLSQNQAKKADVLIDMEFQDVGMFSDHLNQEFYEMGKAKAKAAIPKIKELILNLKKKQLQAG